jgi:outer membrane murein-binding lipoprotein Lpp
MEITVLLVSSMIECLIVVFVAGRKSRKRIEALEAEVQRLNADIEELNENLFIQLGKKYRA